MKKILLSFVFLLACKDDNLDGFSFGDDLSDDLCPNCLWHDEFNGDALSLSNWNYELGYGNNGWGNDEWQEYTNQNTEMGDGDLIISAKKESDNLGKRDGSITSSRITTQGKFEFGPRTRIEARIKLPWGQGIWPAFWSLGANFSEVGWPACGEFDILEMVGANPLTHDNNKTVHSTNHWKHTDGNHAMYGNSKKMDNPLSSDYNIYELIWTEEFMETKINSISFHKIDINTGSVDEPFHKPFFFILNIAVGGNWPGSPNNETQFPQKMYVDYIRVFQLK